LRVGFHEAGHTVVAVEFRREIGVVRVSADPRSGGSVSGAKTPPCLRTIIPGHPTTEQRKALVEELVITLGGLAGELQAYKSEATLPDTGGMEHLDGDMKIARGYLACLGCRGDERARILDDAWNRATEILDRRYEALLALAKRLHDCEELSGDEARRIVLSHDAPMLGGQEPGKS
jgi:ATP-dependent Zn protease